MEDLNETSAGCVSKVFQVLESGNRILVVVLRQQRFQAVDAVASRSGTVHR